MHIAHFIDQAPHRRRMSNHLLSLHQLLTLEVLVSLVSTTDTGAVDTPAFLGVVALLCLEFAIVLALWIINTVVIDKGGLNRFSSDSSTGAFTLFGSVHLSLHQEALRDH